MKDPRYGALAKLLINYGLEVEKGDLVGIMGIPLAAPLIEAAYREALTLGAHPYVRVHLPSLQEIYLKTAKKHQLAYVSPISAFETEKVDKVLSIWAEENTKALTNTDPAKHAARSAATRDLFVRFQEREAAGEMKWCGTQFPCEASAQDAEMSLEEYEDFVFRACRVHLTDPVAAWRRVHNSQAKICRKLDRVRKIRIVREDTDLTMRVEGRKWINCDGQVNMPDGEIYTGPLEDSVEGTIAFSFPACYGGREVEDVRLTFRKGRVTKATASKGLDYLEAQLASDEGASRVGEFAIGTNYGIQRFTKNTLFDEKIGGTIHMAMGASIPDSGGTNVSGIHWDMVTDMRDGGRIYADGKIIYKDGKFTI